MDPSKMTTGLQCVTCLFGVFDLNTGLPMMGVVNQPFFQIQTLSNGKKVFQSRCIWGYDIDGEKGNNIAEVVSDSRIDGQRAFERTKDVVLVGGGDESDTIRENLEQIAEISYVAGAGHKLLRVALGYADLLVSTSKSTYFWDTCSGHAVLRSMGGGLIGLLEEDMINVKNLENQQIRYRPKTDNAIENYNNSKGLIAYPCPSKLSNYLHLLRR